MEAPPSITIIGTGGLGRALATALKEAGYPIKSVFNRTVGKARELAAKIDTETYGAFPKKEAYLGKIIFITVADSAIREVAQRLGTLSADWEKRIVVHCSGNEPADLLSPLKNKGAHTAAFHPLQTFTKAADPSHFKEIYFTIQGDESTFEMLERIAQQLGSKTMQVSRRQKSELHAAAVFASNYFNTLLNAAVDTATLSGLSGEQVKKALLPLVKTTLQNVEGQTFEEALTGPIARGDIETVKGHLELLKEKKELNSLYRRLGKNTVALAQKAQKISPDKADKLLDMLNE